MKVQKMSVLKITIILVTVNQMENIKIRLIIFFAAKDREDLYSHYILGGSKSKESTCNEGDLGLTPGWEYPLEEGMATHSSILAWRIPMDREAS